MGERASRWSDLGQRVGSAVVLAPVALLCIWVGSFAFAGLILLAAAGLSGEWARLCGAQASRPPGVFVPVLVVCAGLATALGQVPVGAGLLPAGLAGLWLVTRRGALSAGVVYVGLATVAILWLRGEGAAGRLNVMFVVAVVWASDIGAYAVGRMLGGPKLAPALSPGKTWSGAVGGLIAAALVGQWTASALGGAAPGGAAVLAAVLGIAAQIGDLLESGIKRHFGVKDSGRLIPGHGGLLDRLDGLLLAAPVAALVMLASRGDYVWQ